MQAGRGPGCNGRTMHVRARWTRNCRRQVVEEVVIVSTDIEAPKATAFAKVYPPDVRADGRQGWDDPRYDAQRCLEHRRFGEFANVKASAFVAPAGTVGTTDPLLPASGGRRRSGTTAVDEAMAAAEIMGTFNGAMGTYKCAAEGADDDDACSVTVNTMGVVSAVSEAGDWVFIPSDGATVDVDDADYLQLRLLADADDRCRRHGHLQRGPDLRRFFD